MGVKGEEQKPLLQADDADDDDDGGEKADSNNNNNNNNNNINNSNSNNSNSNSNSNSASSPEKVDTLQRRVNQFLEDPTSSVAAYLYANGLIVLILASIVTLCIETLPDLYNRDRGIWFAVESVLVSAFTIDYLLRLYAAPDRLRWAVQLLNVVDFVAILPYFIEVIVGNTDDEASSGFSLLRLLRLFRLFRLFKLSRYSLGFRVVFRTIAASRDALVLLLFLCFIIMIFFGTLIYYLERGEWDATGRKWVRQNGDPSSFQSIPDAFWYILISLTTVGYGDVYPVTGGGKLFATIVMLVGILVVAFPIAVIGNNFQAEWKEAHIEQRAYLAKLKRQPSLASTPMFFHNAAAAAAMAFSSSNSLNVPSRSSASSSSSTMNVNNSNNDTILADGGQLPHAAAGPAEEHDHDDEHVQFEREEARLLAEYEAEEAMPDELVAQLSLRQKINRLYKFPHKSLAGMILDWFMIILILFSIGSFCVESLPDQYEEHESAWFALETVVAVLFTIDYLIRLVVAENTREFLFQTLNIVDLLAVMPYYLELVIRASHSGGEDGSEEADNDIAGLGAIRVLRLIRVFRVVRVFRDQFDVVHRTMRRSRQPLMLMMSLLCIAVVFFSALEYYCERGEWDEETRRWIRQGEKSPFQSIPHSFWWAVVTMTTVGYGDAFPVTLWGKIVAVAAALTGILTIAFPISVVTVNFTEEWTKMTERVKARTERHQQQQQQRSSE